VEQFEEMAHMLIDPVMQRDFPGGSDNLFELHSAKSFMDMQQTFEGAGNGNGTKADIEIL
jgi:hypothetical protein